MPEAAALFSHPSRLRIMEAVEHEPQSPKDLAALLDEPLQNVSYHVRALKDAGWLIVKRRTRVRGAVQTYYRVSDRWPELRGAAHALRNGGAR
jgi:DNA-binding transcriptional ArsR family regulator